MTHSYPSDAKQTIRDTRLSDIIKRNTAITNLQANMFFVRACPGFSSMPTDEEEEEEVASRSVQTEEPLDLNVADPTVFPNPSHDAVTVVVNNSGEAGMIQLFSGRDGSLVKTIPTSANDREIRIDLSDLPKGVYTVTIKNGDTSKFIKLVKL